MPGNEIPENIHNFFGQDTTQSRQSQVVNGAWPILNNNPWVDIHRQNGTPPAFSSKNYAPQLSGSEQGNDLQPVQTPLSSNSSQKPDLIRSLPRNQQFNLNGHSSQGLQNSHNLTQRSFSTFDSQQSNVPGYSSPLTKSSERSEATEAHVNFDFLGGQQMMRNQNPAISQASPIQTQNVNDMQLWQQHLLYKQLKEMQQQQQQIMQLQQGARQQNSLSQLSDVGRQASSNQSPTILSGMPINRPSNNMWSNEFVGRDLRFPSSSPMFLSANMNWMQRSSMQGIPNGLMFSRDQGQAVRDIGFSPQQPDQSFFGTPVASTKGSLDHQSQFQGTQGTLHDFSPVVNQVVEPSAHSSAFNCFQSDQSAVPEHRNLQDGVSLSEQQFQGKSQLHNAVTTSGNFQQANHISPGIQQVGPSGIANMDATEEKLLFSTDDGNQDTSFGVSSDRSMGGCLHGNLMQSSDDFSSFPTLNSGSWSALMQEAVEASSSDTGLNEEWSGLSFQKRELSSGKKSSMLQDNNNNRKQQTWHDQNIQNESPLATKPLPLFNDPSASSKSHPTNFHQSMNFSCQGTDGVPTDAFNASFQQSCKEAIDKPFDHAHQGKQLDEGIIHMQTQFSNISNGVWTERTHEEPASSTHSSEAEFNPHNMQQHSWAHQQKVSLHGHSGSGLDDWNTQSLASAGGNSSNLYDSEERRQANDTERTMNAETNHDGSMWKVAGTGVAVSLPDSTGRREAAGSHTSSLIMHSGDSYAGNLSANSNRCNLNKETSQQGHLSDMQRNAKAAVEMQHTDDISRDPATNIFSRSTSQFPEYKKAGLSSQNMLELLHKVDQSKEGKTAECFGFFEQNTPSGRHGVNPSDRSFSHLQSNQSPAFQGFGLKLGPPSQRESSSDHGLPPHASVQAVHDFQRNHELRTREDQSRPSSTTSVQSVPSSDDTAQRENHEAKSFLSGHNKALYSNFQGNPLAAAAYSVRMNQSLLQQRQQQQQLQWQQQQKQQLFSSSSSSRSNDQSQYDAKQSSHPGKRQESHDVSEPDQSSDARMPSAGATCVSAASQFYPGNTGPSHPIDASFHLRSSGQQIPIGETRSIGHPVATPTVSQQGGFSTKSHNVWTSVSSQQRISRLQSQKVISNVVPRSPFPNDKGTLQVQQKAGNQNKRKGGAPSDFGTCSTNSQQESYGEDHCAEDSASRQMPPPYKVDIDLKTGSVLQGTLMEPEAERHADGNPTVHLHLQDLSKAKYVQDSVSEGHKGQVSLQNFASSWGNSFSLLQQMQSMKGTDPDPTGRDVKRLKGTAFGMDSSQMGWVAGQRHNYEQNIVSRENDAISQNISSSADIQVLSFSSRDNKENSANAPTQVIDREIPSQDLLTSKQNDVLNHSHPHDKTPPAPSAGLQMSPQMAPLCFERYGNLQIGQTLARFNGLGSFQRNTKALGSNYVLPKVSERMEHCFLPEQKDDTSLVDNLQQSTLSTTIVPSHAVHSPGKVPLQVIEHNRMSKKHKGATIDLLPWNKKVTQGRCGLQSISTKEQDWARASNRLIEKLEQEFEMSEDGMARSRNRLMITTQLMQQILPSVPARYLCEDAATSYESVIYLMAKLILGDACSTISCSGSDHHVDLDSGNMILGKLKISETEGNIQFSRFVETFIERSQNQENDFLRLDKMASLLDVRLECQDLERNSIMNRFAKFHGRTQSEGVESSLTSEAAPRRSFPQRHVTVHALPRNLPDGVDFLSL